MLDGMPQWQRTVLLQIGHIGRTTRARAQLSSIAKSLITAKSARYLRSCSFTAIRNMMGDTGASSGKGSASNLLPEMDEDGNYGSGGFTRWLGLWSCPIYWTSTISLDFKYKSLVLNYLGHGLLFSIYKKQTPSQFLWRAGFTRVQDWMITYVGLSLVSLKSSMCCLLSYNLQYTYCLQQNQINLYIMKYWVLLKNWGSLQLSLGFSFPFF